MANTNGKIGRGVCHGGRNTVREMCLAKFVQLTILPALLSLAAVLSILPSAATAAGEDAAGVVCRGESCRLEPPRNPAVARIVNATARARNHGSGTLVKQAGAGGIILTCAHIFSEGAGSITVTFPDGSSYQAELLGTDRQWDLAVLRIARPRAAEVTIASVAPRPGQWVSSCGYGRDGRYWCNRGQARGYVQTEGTRSFETLEISGMARQGDSGGPIFNDRGELVAVLWGTDGRVVGGTYCGRIRLFLARVFGGLSGDAAIPRRGEPQMPTPRETGPQNPVGERPVVPVVRDGEKPAALERFRKRLEGIETRMEGPGLRDKAREAARQVAREVAKDVAGRVAEEFLAGRQDAAASSWVPGLVAGLGWTGPPAIAATLGIMLAGRLLRRRVRKKRGQKTEAGGQGRTPLNDSYAAQLADVFALSGHSSTADATLGREYDKELLQAATSSDGALAAWACSMRDRVAQRFYRIHGRQPMPAEPVEDERRTAAD